MLIAPESRGGGGSRWPPQGNNKDQRSSRVKVKENGGKPRGRKGRRSHLEPRRFCTAYLDNLWVTGSEVKWENLSKQ